LADVIQKNLYNCNNFNTALNLIVNIQSISNRALNKIKEN